MVQILWFMGKPSGWWAVEDSLLLSLPFSFQVLIQINTVQLMCSTQMSLCKQRLGIGHLKQSPMGQELPVSGFVGNLLTHLYSILRSHTVLAHCLFLTFKSTHGDNIKSASPPPQEHNPSSQRFLRQSAADFCTQTHLFFSLYISSLNEAQTSTILMDLELLAFSKINAHN